MNWKIIFALLAVSLLIAGCAKGGQRGGTNEAAAGGTGAGGTAGTGGGVSGGAGTQTGGTSASNVGDLFQIDTDKPLEGSGYDVPAAGEE